MSTFLVDGYLVVSNLLLFRTVMQWVIYYGITSCRCYLHLKDKGLQVEMQCQRLHVFVISMNVVQLTSPQRLYKQCERGPIYFILPMPHVNKCLIFANLRCKKMITALFETLSSLSFHGSLQLFICRSFISGPTTLTGAEDPRENNIWTTPEFSSRRKDKQLISW